MPFHTTSYLATDIISRSNFYVQNNNIVKKFNFFINMKGKGFVFVVWLVVICWVEFFLILQNVASFRKDT